MQLTARADIQPFQSHSSLSGRDLRGWNAVLCGHLSALCEAAAVQGLYLCHVGPGFQPVSLH